MTIPGSLAALLLSVYRLLLCCGRRTLRRSRANSLAGSSAKAGAEKPTTSSLVRGNLPCRRTAGATPVVACGVTLQIAR